MSYDLLLQGTGPIPQEKAAAVFELASSLWGEPTPAWDPPFGRDPEDSRENVQEMLADGELRAEDYRLFCRSHSLSDGIDPVDPDAAATFLLYFWGCPLVWFKLWADVEEARDIYRRVVDFARQQQLDLHDPQVGDDIDLDHPGEFPPGYL